MKVLFIKKDSQTCKNDEFLKSFLDYCEKYADVRSGFDYESSSIDDDTPLDLGFEDIKFQKLKIAESKKIKTELKREKKPKVFDQVQIETEEDKQFQSQVVRIIETLNGEHTFPSDLNSRQRRIVHELGEKYKLYHMSKGLDDKRSITISKFEIKLPERNENNETQIKPVEVSLDSEKEMVQEKLENVNLDINESKIFNALQDELLAPESKAKKKKNNNNQETAKNEKSKVEAESKIFKSNDAQLLGEITDQNDSNLNFRSDCRQCKNCSKYILNVNFLMHELHCTKVNKESKPKIIDYDEKGACSIEPKLDTKIKKNPIQTSNTDDFDELLNMFQDTNNVCNYKGCKTLVKTLGQNCEFCRHRFCLTHSLAEVFKKDNYFLKS